MRATRCSLPRSGACTSMYPRVSSRALRPPPPRSSDRDCRWPLLAAALPPSALRPPSAPRSTLCRRQPSPLADTPRVAPPSPLALFPCARICPFRPFPPFRPSPPAVDSYIHDLVVDLEVPAPPSDATAGPDSTSFEPYAALADGKAKGRPSPRKASLGGGQAQGKGLDRIPFVQRVKARAALAAPPARPSRSVRHVRRVHRARLPARVLRRVRFAAQLCACAVRPS